MALFGKELYDRTDTLERAARAAGKGKRKKAIEEYRKVLSHEPENPQIHSKLGILLAETRQYPEAWKSFVAAAEGFKKQGFADKQYSVYAQATRYMPHEIELWETLGKLNVNRGRKPDAVRVLLDGRRHFKSKKDRPMAIRLLKLALDIEPWDFQPSFELAKLLYKEGDRDGAKRIFDGLTSRYRGRKTRRVRGAQFRLSPGPITALRWLKALITGR